MPLQCRASRGSRAHHMCHRVSSCIIMGQHVSSRVTMCPDVGCVLSVTQKHHRAHHVTRMATLLLACCEPHDVCVCRTMPTSHAVTGGAPRRRHRGARSTTVPRPLRTVTYRCIPLRASIRADRIEARGARDSSASRIVRSRVRVQPTGRTDRQTVWCGKRSEFVVMV